MPLTEKSENHFPFEGDWGSKVLQILLWKFLINILSVTLIYQQKRQE